MNADQGFRRAPGNLLRVAAGAGAAALIVTAVSAARRARTAMADREWPGDATGPAAPSGPLTTATAQPAPDVSPPAAAPKAVTASDLAAGQVAISAALLFFGVTALSAVAGRRRADGKRGAAHARTPGRQDENGNDALQHTDDYPSWPGRPGPYALHPDHPSWGGGRTDPRWDSTEAALRQDGYSSWPESAAPPWGDAEPPAADDASGWRRGPRAGFAPRHGPALQPRATGVMERVWPEVDRVPQAGRVQPAQGQVWDAASVELATWIISEANQQATEIRHEARDDAATARADAKLQAAKLVQQAADQAAATLAAAELQAARIRAEILKLSADLGGVATSFTEGLLGPAKPATKPAAPAATKAAAPSATEPAARLATKPATKPAARPAPKPATRSATAPATKPGVSPRRIKPDTQAAGQTKTRQVSAARKVTAALVALTLAGVATGATELVLHGPAFFVFRANGAGASQTGPEEDQGPGQPNAPGAHHNAKVIPVKTKAKVIPAKGKHAKKDPKQAGIPD